MVEQWGFHCRKRRDAFALSTACWWLWTLPRLLSNWQPRAGLTNLWHSCPRWHAERSPWHTKFSAVQNFFLAHSASLYIHISDCVESVYELPLLPNNSASETFLHKSGAVRSVDWIFITGAPAWRWLGEYVTLNKTFYNLPFKQEVLVPSYFHIVFLSAFHEEAFIRNIIIILCINYVIVIFINNK